MVALDRDAWRGHEVRLRRTSRRPYGRRRNAEVVAGAECAGRNPVVTRDQIRQVAIIRSKKSTARRLGLGYLNGNARLGLPRTTNTPHGLTTKTSAQLPLMWVTSHRRFSIN